MTGKCRSRWLVVSLSLIPLVAAADSPAEQEPRAGVGTLAESPLPALRGRPLPEGEVTSEDVRNEQLPESQVTYPVVLRIPPTVLTSMLSREVEHSASVDNVIVGTRARGTSHTKGDLAFHLVENRNDDFLVVKFQGRTQSRTVGTSGPVTIQSRSETRFLCTNRIRFDPLQGLVAGPTEITSTTTLVYESIQPTRRGIGSRLVGRVAQRRAADSHAQATQEIAQDQRAKLIREFDSRLHAQLASLNRRTQMIRYAGGMWRSSGPVPFAAIVTPDGLQLGLGVPRTLSPSSQIPPITGNSPAAEIWIHGSVFSDLLSPLASFARQRSDWNSTTSRSVPAAVENVWIRVALGSSGEWPQITGGTSSDGYTFVSNLLSKIPLDIPDVSSQSMVPPSGSDAQVVDLTWLLGLLIADNSK